MDDRTMINREVLPQDQKTLINRELVQWRALEEQKPLKINKGDILLDRYTVMEKLKTDSAEADLYLCESREKRRIIAKVYRRKAAVKKEVAEKLREIRSPYVAKLFEITEYKGKTVEILQYYKNGCIQGKKYDLSQLKGMIIPCINEGLHALHEKGILHKDLKPSNIMLCDDGKSVALIDFGVSSLMNTDSTVLMTQTGMTPAYSAPETFRDLFMKESDYFSFGVLLFELYCGRTPYAGMSKDDVARYTAIQRIPLPEDMPVTLQNLIAALTYPDITNRGKTENPNRRWTYDEVKKWLSGIEQPIPGGLVGKYAMQRFAFMGNAYEDTRKFAEALGKYWEEGKRLLFHGQLTRHMKKCNLDAAKWCQQAEQEAQENSGHDDRVYWKLLYKFAPEQTKFWWKGESYESLPVFGRVLLEKLWVGDRKILEVADSILGECILSSFVEEKAPKDEKLLKAARALEEQWHMAKEENEDRTLTYYAMAYALSGQKVMKLNGQEIHTISELSEFMKEKLDISLQEFKDFCHELVDYKGNLNAQLESWLIALGKAEQVDRWREKMNGTLEEEE